MIEDDLKAIEASVASIRAQLPSNLARVSTTEDLQKAVDDFTIKTILVKPGLYGTLTLRNGVRGVTIRPDTILGEGRVSNDWKESLIKLAQLDCEPKAESYYLNGFQFLPRTDPGYPIINLGTDKETNPLNTPNNIWFNQCIISADPTKGGKRGMALNCRIVYVMHSLLENFKYSSDSQAIQAQNGPGPHTINDCYLSASGENFLLGGADPTNELMIPSNLTFTNNLCTKDMTWMGMAGVTSKNCFELKNIIGAIIENNIFENSWTSGQTGYLVVFTPRNQGGSAPFTVVRDVDFRWNVMRNGGAGINMIGDDNVNPSQRTENITIEQNLMYDIGTLPGAQRLNMIGRNPLNVNYRNNTMIGVKVNSFLDFEMGAENFSALNNYFSEGSYGLKGTYTGSVTGNIIGPPVAPRLIKYEPGNVKTTLPLGPDYKYQQDPSKGCDIDELRRRVKF